MPPDVIERAQCLNPLDFSSGFNGVFLRKMTKPEQADLASMSDRKHTAIASDAVTEGVKGNLPAEKILKVMNSRLTTAESSVDSQIASQELVENLKFAVEPEKVGTGFSLGNDNVAPEETSKPQFSECKKSLSKQGNARRGFKANIGKPIVRYHAKGGGLDDAMQKHALRFHKEKATVQTSILSGPDTKSILNPTEGGAGELGWVQSSLANIGIKKLSKLEKEKEAAAAATAAGQDPWQRGSKAAKKTLKTSENTWGGLSLGASLKRHQSKLQLEQAAFRRAEAIKQMQHSKQRLIIGRVINSPPPLCENTI